jgi:hypothetical protein
MVIGMGYRKREVSYAALCNYTLFPGLRSSNKFLKQVCFSNKYFQTSMFFKQVLFKQVLRKIGETSNLPLPHQASAV